MSQCDPCCSCQQQSSSRKFLCDRCQGSESDCRRLKKREKNRVAAQKSRKKQTEKADVLHEACELLEQRNRKLRREVDSLSEEQQLLTDALRLHESCCPIMHCCSFGATTTPSSF